MSDAIFLCFGSPDECQNCGGSASLGGTQEPIVCGVGTYCSMECHDESLDFMERTKRISDWCPACGYDNHEHSPDCTETT
jgi:hypothetical protein